MPIPTQAPASRRPALIAHRGASRAFLENTLPAFQRALELGVDGIELDVHGTRDGVLVVHHDPTLKRLDDEVPIAELTAAEVGAFRLPGGEHVPTLAEVFALADGHTTLYVEVKAPHVESLVADFLSAHREVSAEVHAFDHRIPVGVRARRADTRIGLLRASYPLDLPAALANSGATAWWQHAPLIDEALVVTCHDAGVRLIAWTVNSAPHARQLAAWGVDALCTDLPDLIRTALSAATPPPT